jgi:outer membrane protein TolC
MSRQTYRLLVAFLSFLLLATSSYPQEESAPPVELEGITLEEAVSLAISNSTEIRKTAVSIRDNETRLSEETVWNWLRPNLSLRTGYDVPEGEPRFSLGAGIDLRDVMGAGRRRIRTLQFSISEERKNLEALKASLGIKVKGAYREYRLAREKVDLLEETLRSDEKLLAEIEASGSKTELLLIRSIVNQDRLALLTARKELEGAETDLRVLLGSTPERP